MASAEEGAAGAVTGAGASASRHMAKCDECRKGNVKQKLSDSPEQQCTPVDRLWPGQKCDRCHAKGLPCGPNVKSRKRCRDSEEVIQGLRDPTTPSNSTCSYSLFTPPSTGTPRAQPGLTFVPRDVNSSPSSRQSFSTSNQGSFEDSRLAFCIDKGETRTKDDASSKHVYLGYLRILYEFLVNCQVAVSPNGLVLPKAQRVHSRLISMAGNVVQEYKFVLRTFISHNYGEAAIQFKARLLEALEAVRTMNTIAENIAKKEMFSEAKARIYESLIDIYKKEDNEPEVERYMILIEEQRLKQHETDTTISTRIADSLRRTSQELIRVSGEISRNLESPLLDSPWLHDSDNPFPSLHRALRAGLDKVSEILAKDTKGLVDCDFLKRVAIQVAAECGSTLLEEGVFDEPDLRKERDILGRNAIFDAANHGKLDAFRTLVQRDDKLIFGRDSDGATLMDVLAAGGYTDFARYLLSLGFDVKEPSLGAASPLHTAAKRGDSAFCDLLLDAGAEPAYVLPDGNCHTAAMAAYIKSLEVVDEKARHEFYSLSLRIAKAEKPPHHSLKWIERRVAEAKAGQTPTISQASDAPNDPLPPIGQDRLNISSSTSDSQHMFASKPRR